MDMLGKILPRHLQIIFEINDYFLKTLQEQYPNDTDLLSRTSIIDESNGRRVRMARLAVVVSHKVNGVSELHSRLMVESLFAEFRQNLPNALYQRDQRYRRRAAGWRWPTRRCRNCWMSISAAPGGPDLSQLDELKQHIDYPMVNQAVRQAKFENKQRLASYIAQQLNVVQSIRRRCLMCRSSLSMNTNGS